MAVQIDMDMAELIKLTKYFQKAPKKFAAASAMWLNRAAFGVRKEILGHISRTMVERSPSFVKGRVRVQKSRTWPMSAQQAEVGSVRKARFTGWAEQEGRAVDKRDKTITTDARGGSLSKRVKPSHRMKRGRNYRDPSGYAGKTRRARANRMLQEIGRTRDRKPFVIHGHRTLSPGLYRFGAGAKGARELIALQIFGRKPARPRRNPWMTASVARYFSRLNRRQAWADIIRRVRAAPKK